MRIEPAKEKRLWAAYLDGRSKAARDTLFTLYMPIAEMIVTKYIQSGKPSQRQRHGDLLGAAHDGLLAAIERFEPERKVIFFTFASRRIIGAVLDYVRIHSPVSRYANLRVKLIDEIDNLYRASLGRPPTIEEICEGAGITSKQYHAALEKSRRTISLFEEQKGDYGSFAPLKYLHAGEEHEYQIANEIFEKSIEYLLQYFSITRALIVRLRFREGLTQREIGEHLGVTESRANQIEKMTVRILQARFAARGKVCQ